MLFFDKNAYVCEFLKATFCVCVFSSVSVFLLSHMWPAITSVLDCTLNVFEPVVSCIPGLNIKFISAIMCASQCVHTVWWCFRIIFLVFLEFGLIFIIGIKNFFVHPRCQKSMFQLLHPLDNTSYPQGAALCSLFPFRWGHVLLGAEILFFSSLGSVKLGY